MIIADWQCSAALSGVRPAHRQPGLDGLDWIGLAWHAPWWYTMMVGATDNALGKASGTLAVRHHMCVFNTQAVFGCHVAAGVVHQQGIAPTGPPYQ